MQNERLLLLVKLGQKQLDGQREENKRTILTTKLKVKKVEQLFKASKENKLPKIDSERADKLI